MTTPAPDLLKQLSANQTLQQAFSWLTKQAHYQDGWVVISPKRYALKRVVKQVYGVLDALKLETAPDKTFSGRINKSFGFLGFQLSPAELTVSQPALSRRDAKATRLLEQGADKKRIGRYLAKWLAWVGGVALAGQVAAGECYQNVGPHASNADDVSLGGPPFEFDLNGDGLVDGALYFFMTYG